MLLSRCVVVPAIFVVFSFFNDTIGFFLHFCEELVAVVRTRAQSVSLLLSCTFARSARRRVATSVPEQHRAKVFCIEADVTDANLLQRVAECVQRAVKNETVQPAATVQPSSASPQTVHQYANALTTGAGVADLVTCSYSLSMIPHWRGAVDQAHALLREGGNLGVADFLSWRQASRASHFSWAAWARHHALRTSYLSTGVDTEKPLLACVRGKFVTKFCRVQTGGIPFVPSAVCTSPFFVFSGVKQTSKPKAGSPGAKRAIVSPATSFANLVRAE